MKWFRHNAISEKDFELLAGTKTMEIMQKNRLVIVYKNGQDSVSDVELGINKCKGLHFRKALHNDTNFREYFSGQIDKAFEYLFELESDLKIIEENLHIAKIKYS